MRSQRVRFALRAALMWLLAAGLGNHAVAQEQAAAPQALVQEASSQQAMAPQAFVFEWNPRTGDDWLDAQLTDINVYAQRYRDSFIDDMTRYYAAPRALVEDLIVTRRWAPGDVVHACAIAQVLGRPCRTVISAWSRSHADGWEALARELGIDPASKEQLQIKRALVHSYDRWSRPITLDRPLRRELSGRNKRPYRVVAAQSDAAKDKPD